jgi:thiamine transport system substrate-binding protein
MTRFMYRALLLTVLLLIPLAMSVGAQDETGGDELPFDGVTLTLVTYDSFAMSEEVLEAFEAETGITLEILRLSDAGAMVNQSILTINNPLGDVLYGIDNTFLTRGLNADLFIPYESPLLEDIPEEFRLDDEEHRVTPVTYGDVCLNYDVAYFEDNDLAVPESLEALTAPEYSGLLAVQNPATSSPGLAFLLTTIAVFGEEGDYTYRDYWADLVANNVLITDGWSETYYGAFTAASGDGDRPLVVSYASSPPVEVYFMEAPPEQAPTAAITAAVTCFRQIEFAGILQGTENESAAQVLIDFFLSEQFQEDVPLQMFVFPVLPEAELPEVFVEYSQIAEEPITVAIEDIEEHRERWIQEWTETVRR